MAVDTNTSTLNVNTSALNTNTSTLNTNAYALNTNTNALTANALAGNDTLFKQYGFDSFISKPIDIRQLNAVLNTYVRDTHPEEAEKWIFELPSQIRIKKEVDPKLLKMFRCDAEHAVLSLRETIQNGDIKLFTTTAHAMKSALANVLEHDATELAFRGYGLLD